METLVEAPKAKILDFFPLDDAETKRLETRHANLKKKENRLASARGHKARVIISGDLSQLILPLSIGDYRMKQIFPVISSILPEDDASEVAVESPDEEAARLEDLRKAFFASDDETYEALRYDPVSIHSALLEGSLSALRTMGDTKEKIKILEWIFAPDILGWRDDVGEIVWFEDVDPKDRMLYTESGWTVLWERDRQLSYQFCCRLFGFRPECFQEQIEKELLVRGITINL